MKSSYRQILPYLAMLKKVWQAFAASAFFGILYGVASGFGFPFLFQYIMPRVYAETTPTGWTLILLVLYLPVVFLVRNVSFFYSEYLAGYCGVRVLERLRVQIFDKLQRLPLAYFETQQRGDLISRVLADTQLLQTGVTKAAMHLVRDPATLVAALGYLTYRAVQNSEVLFLLISVLVIPVCVLPVRAIGKSLHRRAVQMQEETGGLTETISENLGAAREIRAFGLEKYQSARFRAALKRLISFQLKVIKYQNLTTPSIEFISSLGVSIALYYSVRSGVSLEELLALMGALYFAYEPLRKLGAVHNHVKQASAAADRIEAVLNTEETIRNAPEPLTPSRVRGEICFHQVGFSYGEGMVLMGVNVRLSAGQTVALVGPSGAGKSTFANLIPRFYDPVEGSITLDDTDLRQLDIAALRKHIALVPQEPVLFNDTIFNNLQLSRAGASEDDIFRAAERAYAHLFIEELEHGYQTLVGERGARLSGGQKQRIALARAFLREAPILIMDEPTSALDAESETIIQQALQELVRNRTVVIIAHRFSTIRFADTILVFDSGRIVNQGSHDQLLESSPLYKKLYEQQTMA